MLTAETRIEDVAWSEAVWPDGLCYQIEVVLEATARQLEASGCVDILFTSDVAMRKLNASWRNMDQPTDILSFPVSVQMPGCFFLGDLALGWGCMEREAGVLSRPIHLHLRHLLVHGLLHLLGYDHESVEEARIMEGLERSILRGLGLPEPYDV